MNIESIRALNRERLESYLQCYAERPESFPPMRAAKLWLDAFEASEVDFEKAHKAMEEALPFQNRYDLAFFAFCSEMQKVLHELWKEKLGAND